MSEMFESYCEMVDKLVTVDMRGRGVCNRLYPAARAGGESLAARCTKLIDKTVREGDLFFIITGSFAFLTPTALIPETDGPPGAAALGRSVKLAYGATPIILTEPGTVKIAMQACRGLGMMVADVEEARRAGLAAVVLPFPISLEEAKKESKRLLNELNPSMVVAIEKNSPNEKGVYHSSAGICVDNSVAKVGVLWENAVSRGIPTIGVADGGNEIGMGNVIDTVKQYVPNGAMCKCPCGGGIAASTKATELFVASISNWSTYGICAGMAALKGDLDLIQTGEMEKRALRACVDAGAVGGGRKLKLSYPIVDGMDEEVNSWIPEMLRRSFERYFIDLYRARGKVGNR